MDLLLKSFRGYPVNPSKISRISKNIQANSWWSNLKNTKKNIQESEFMAGSSPRIRSIRSIQDLALGSRPRSSLCELPKRNAETSRCGAPSHAFRCIKLCILAISISLPLLSINSQRYSLLLLIPITYEAFWTITETTLDDPQVSDTSSLLLAIISHHKPTILRNPSSLMIPNRSCSAGCSAPMAALRSLRSRHGSTRRRLGCSLGQRRLRGTELDVQRPGVHHGWFSHS